MALKLTFLTCLLCERSLARAAEQIDLDGLDEEGRRNQTWCRYVLPPKRYRMRLAPDVCDLCWKDHQLEMEALSDGRRRRAGYFTPSFRAIYFWAFVAARLKAVGDRMNDHMQEKADRGNGVVRKGPLRQYGPRKVVYQRGRYSFG